MDDSPLCSFFGRCKEYTALQELRVRELRLRAQLVHAEKRVHLAEEMVRAAEEQTLRAEERLRVVEERIRTQPLRDRDRAASRKHRLKKRGLPEGWYEAKLAEQGGGCAICGVPPAPGEHHCVDHDHTTGAVRGILCLACNSGIGHLREKPSNFTEAIRYLERYKARPTGSS